MLSGSYRKSAPPLRNVMLGCGALLTAACAADVVGSHEQDVEVPGRELASDSSAGKYDRDPDAAQVRAAVEDLGFSLEGLEIDGDIIRVEQDIILRRELLLNGEYEPAAHIEQHTTEELDREPIQKGYRYSSLVSAANVSNIDVQVTYIPAQWTDPNELWAWLLYWTIPTAGASSSWNGIPNSAISISPNRDDSTSKIVITVIPADKWPAGTDCSASTLACADFPSNAKPGRNLYVKADWTSWCSSGEWTNEFAQRVLAHEIGHALGFTHPGSFTHIPNTARCTAANPASCPINPGYSTIMSGGAAGVCTANVYTPTADDRASAAAVY